MNMACNLKINTGDFFILCRLFFDGFVCGLDGADQSIMLDHQVEEAIRRTEYIINQLQHM